MKHLYAIVTLGATAVFGVVYHASQPPVVTLLCDGEFADPFVHRDGKREARAALAEGRLVSVTFGKLAAWTPELREVLRDDYDIEYRAIAGCLVSDATLRYAREFNAVMEPAILKHHGPHVFEEASARAEKLFAERQQRETALVMPR